MEELKYNKEKLREKINRILDSGIRDIQNELNTEMPTNPNKDWDDIKTKYGN